MTIHDRYFDDLADLARRVEEGDHFDTDLRTFMEAARALRNHLYDSTEDPLVHEHLDLLPDRLDLSPPDGPLLQHFLPKSGRQMYGKYRQREKIREQVKRIAARFAVIRRLMR